MKKVLYTFGYILIFLFGCFTALFIADDGGMFGDSIAGIRGLWKRGRKEE